MMEQAADWPKEAAQALAQVVTEIRTGRPFRAFSLRRLFTLYLVASYLYYQQDRCIMADEDYDHLCRYLWEHWDRAEEENVWNRGLVTPEDLIAGTGYAIKEYPQAIQWIALFIF